MVWRDGLCDSRASEESCIESSVKDKKVRRDDGYRCFPLRIPTFAVSIII
jgi:hypothetical protein